MAYMFVTPEWFFVYGIILEIFFAVITFFVSMYAYKIYKLTEERQLKIFSIAFLFIAVAYVVQAIMNILIYAKLDDDVANIVKLQAVYLFTLLGTYMHALLFITGLIILAYFTLKIKSVRTLILLIVLAILGVIFSTNKVFTFYVLASVLLLFTVIYYFNNYINNKKTNTLLVLIAMIFLFFATLHFMFAIQHEIYYVLGHILEFIGYLLILIDLILILQHGKKTR
jgi:hypothetical protein